MKITPIHFSPADVDMSEIFLSVAGGNSDYVPDAEMSAFVDDVVREGLSVCRACYSYKIFDRGDVTGSTVVISGVEMIVGRTIAGYLRESERFALFVATAGVEFDAWLHSLRASGDIMREYVADSLGSWIAEATAEAAHGAIAQYAAQQELRVSNRYSPGYCNWHVREQQKFFGLLDDAPCGVVLNDSSLMTPVKSVSGIIGIGRDVERKPYGCAVCGLTSCYMRRL